MSSTQWSFHSFFLSDVTLPTKLDKVVLNHFDLPAQVVFKFVHFESSEDLVKTDSQAPRICHSNKFQGTLMLVQRSDTENHWLHLTLVSSQPARQDSLWSPMVLKNSSIWQMLQPVAGLLVWDSCCSTSSRSSHHAKLAVWVISLSFLGNSRNEHPSSPSPNTWLVSVWPYTSTSYHTQTTSLSC